MADTDTTAAMTQIQKDAGILVLLRDRFTYQDVVGALIQAGVENDDFVASRAAEQILQHHARAGLIEPAELHRHWRRVVPIR